MKAMRGQPLHRRPIGWCVPPTQRRSTRSILVPAFTVLLVGLSSCGATLRDEIPWKRSYPLALEAAIEQGKPILVYWNAEWCTICKRMADESLVRPEIRAAMEAFVPLSIDIDHDAKFAEKYSVAAVPMFMLLDRKGNIQAQSIGYLSYDALRTVLGAWSSAAKLGEAG